MAPRLSWPNRIIVFLLVIEVGLIALLVIAFVNHWGNTPELPSIAGGLAVILSFVIAQAVIALAFLVPAMISAWSWMKHPNKTTETNKVVTVIGGVAASRRWGSAGSVSCCSLRSSSISDDSRYVIT